MRRKSTRPKITVVGGGYVGLATGVFFGDRGYPVTVVEIDPSRVDSLKRGKLHFYEPMLQQKLRQTLVRGALDVSLPEPEHYETAHFVFVAIDSADPDSGVMRLSHFEQMAQWIGATSTTLTRTVVLKSTNTIGFAEAFDRMLNTCGGGGRIHVVVNPEFLREGRAFEDTSQPWRVVIGAKEKRAATALLELYQSLYKASIPIIVTDWKSAELIKLGANVYLSHRLAFIHEIADFVRLEGLDIGAIKQGLGFDPRIGSDYFEPGLGFGGSCLPKDCHLINSSESETEFEFKTARTALEINERILEIIVARLESTLGRLKGKKLAVMGVAFKPEVDDTRNSQPVKLALKLKDQGATVVCFDPFLKEVGRVPGTHLPLESSPELTLRSASALIVGTAHRQFRSLKPKDAAVVMQRKLVCDYFGILSHKTWMQAGFQFI